jgi:hypothetical protein
MFNYIIKTLLEVLTDFGPAALAIILFTITYFDWRMNRITKKLLETNFTVSDLEKENLKQVNDVRADSQRDSQNILLISEMQGKTLTEAFMSLVSHVNKNAEAVITTHDAIQHFSEKLEQLEKASHFRIKLHSEFKRRYDSEYEELDGCVRSLERDLKDLQSTVGFHESIMQVREAGPIEVETLVEPLSSPTNPGWAAEEVLEAEDSLWPEEVREEVENPHSVGVAPVLAVQRSRNRVGMFESRVDVVPDIDDLNKEAYELLLSGYIFDMKEQGLEIPTCGQGVLDEKYRNKLTEMDWEIIRFNETGITARFGEGQEPAPGAYRRGDPQRPL